MDNITILGLIYGIPLIVLLWIMIVEGWKIERRYNKWKRQFYDSSHTKKRWFMRRRK